MINKIHIIQIYINISITLELIKIFIYDTII